LPEQVYIAFNAIHQISFNRSAQGSRYLFEITIDLLFVVDVILNGCTAFYDESGELVGAVRSNQVDDAGRQKPPRPDFKATWAHYSQSEFRPS
jgi:hypothetical protein